MSEWQDISTAPKDGTKIILASWDVNAGAPVAWWLEATYWCDEMEHSGKKFEAGWSLGDEVERDIEHWPATHWLPLTPPRGLT